MLGTALQTTASRFARSAVPEQIPEETLKLITAEAEKLVLESTIDGKPAQADFIQLTNALLTGLKKHRPQIFQDALRIFSEETGTPSVSYTSFAKFILLLNQHGVYFNVRGSWAERQKSGTLAGPVFMSVVGRHPLDNTYSILVESGILSKSELPLLKEALFVRQPQWTIVATAEYGQLVVNLPEMKYLLLLSTNLGKISPAFKQLDRKKILESVLANEILHTALRNSLNFKYRSENVFDGPGPQVAGIQAKPSNNLEAHEFLSDVASLAVSPIDVIRVLSVAFKLTNIQAASNRNFEAVHSSQHPGYDTTVNFAVQALMASFDKRQDPAIRNTLRTYGQRSLAFKAQEDNVTSDSEKKKILNQWLHEQDTFIKKVFKAMKPDDREFIVRQYRKYGAELLAYIRQGQRETQ